jgi:hypothetical protein
MLPGLVHEFLTVFFVDRIVSKEVEGCVWPPLYYLGKFRDMYLSRFWYGQAGVLTILILDIVLRSISCH